MKYVWNLQINKIARSKTIANYETRCKESSRDLSSFQSQTQEAENGLPGCQHSPQQREKIPKKEKGVLIVSKIKQPAEPPEAK